MLLCWILEVGIWSCCLNYCLSSFLDYIISFFFLAVSYVDLKWVGWSLLSGFIAAVQHLFSVGHLSWKKCCSFSFFIHQSAFFSQSRMVDLHVLHKLTSPRFSHDRPWVICFPSTARWCSFSLLTLCKVSFITPGFIFEGSESEDLERTDVLGIAMLNFLKLEAYIPCLDSPMDDISTMMTFWEK